MPFKSEKQRKYLWANEPEIARDWTETYGSKVKKADGGRIGLVMNGETRRKIDDQEQVLVMDEGQIEDQEMHPIDKDQQKY